MSRECPHCQRTYSYPHIKVHREKCLWRPDYLPEVRQLIRSLSSTDFGCTHAQYDAARGEGWPGSYTLRLRLAVPWGDVLRWAGAPGLMCRYCQKPLSDEGVAIVHRRACLADPDVAAAVREWLRANPNQSGRMQSMKDYNKLRPKSLPAGATVAAHFGGWMPVAKWAGMQSYIYEDSEEPGEPYDWSQVLNDDPLEGMNVLRGKRVVREVRQWCIKRKTYLVVGLR